METTAGMEIKSIALFRGLRREIGSYFIPCRQDAYGNDDDGATLERPSGRGCTRPDLLIADRVLPPRVFSRPRYFFRPSFAPSSSRVIRGRTLCHIARITITFEEEVSRRRWMRICVRERRGEREGSTHRSSRSDECIDFQFGSRSEPSVRYHANAILISPMPVL